MYYVLSILLILLINFINKRTRNYWENSTDPITTQKIQYAQRENVKEEDIHKFGLKIENDLWAIKERFRESFFA